LETFLASAAIPPFIILIQLYKYEIENKKEERKMLKGNTFPSEDPVKMWAGCPITAMPVIT